MVFERRDTVGQSKLESNRMKNMCTVHCTYIFDHLDTFDINMLQRYVYSGCTKNETFETLELKCLYCTVQWGNL